ncbi:hypothetical protein BC832DRAFT_592897 [Gaertneriomyces semiglobifer]|nr:hypothetical protein BC832DRAFT_592897 [Gaertneriomyces semiglobifer]
MSAPYRANILSQNGINNQCPVANVQRKQMGFAVDYDQIDEYGQPKVVYSWNRNIHDKDNATKKATAELYQPGQLTSKEELRMSEKRHYTKAYKDALEFIRAEEDYRAQERYLDKVTPSRRNNTASGTSSSHLAIPDQGGNVYHYDAATTAMTGLRFEVPLGTREVIEEPSNKMGRSIDRVILTKEREVTVDPVTGLGHVNYATGVSIPADVEVQDMDIDYPMPGTFPGSIVPREPAPSSPIEEIVDTSSPVQAYAPGRLLVNERDNPAEVQRILDQNTFYQKVSNQPARTPFRTRKEARYVPYSKKSKKDVVLDAPIGSTPHVSTGMEAAVVEDVGKLVTVKHTAGGAEISSAGRPFTTKVDILMPWADARTVSQQHNVGTVSSVANDGPYTTSSIESSAGRRGSDVKLVKGTKRPAMRQLDERQVKKRARIGSAPSALPKMDIQEFHAEDPKELDRRIKMRTWGRQVKVVMENVAPIRAPALDVDNIAIQRGSAVRPLAKLGKLGPDQPDVALVTSAGAYRGTAEPTVSIRKKKRKDVVDERPAKRVKRS